jgi:hypothetical protein
VTLTCYTPYGVISRQSTRDYKYAVILYRPNPPVPDDLRYPVIKAVAWSRTLAGAERAWKRLMEADQPLYGGWAYSGSYCIYPVGIKADGDYTSTNYFGPDGKVKLVL